MPVRRSMAIAAAAALLAVVVSAVVLRHGILLYVDSWQAWQASVSMLSGHGYTLFDDTPILEWPPLYALYLEAWERVMGVSGVTLIAASLALVAAGVFGWTMLFSRLVAPAQARPASKRVTCLVAAFGLYIALFYVGQHRIFALSDNLRMGLLPPFILLTMLAREQRKIGGILGFSALAGLFGAMLMLTHSTGAAYVLAASLMALLAWPFNRLRFLSALVLGVVSAIPWVISRKVLHQDGSHLIGWRVGRFPPMEYWHQASYGIRALLVSSAIVGRVVLIVAVAVIAAALLRPKRETERTLVERRLLFVCGFGCVGIVGVFALFNLVWVENALNGRFVLFFVILLVACAMSAANQLRNPAPVLLASACFIGGAVMMLPRGPIDVIPLTEQEYTFVHPHDAIRRDVRNGPSVRDGALSVIAQPDLEWSYKNYPEVVRRMNREAVERIKALRAQQQ